MLLQASLGRRLLCVLSYFFRIDSRQSVRTVFKFHNLGEGVGWIKIKGSSAASVFLEPPNSGLLVVFNDAVQAVQGHARVLGWKRPIEEGSDQIKMVLQGIEPRDVCMMHVGESTCRGPGGEKEASWWDCPLLEDTSRSGTETTELPMAVPCTCEEALPGCWNPDH